MVYSGELPILKSAWHILAKVRLPISHPLCLCLSVSLLDPELWRSRGSWSYFSSLTVQSWIYLDIMIACVVGGGTVDSCLIAEGTSHIMMKNWIWAVFTVFSTSITNAKISPGRSNVPWQADCRPHLHGIWTSNLGTELEPYLRL